MGKELMYDKSLTLKIVLHFFSLGPNKSFLGSFMVLKEAEG